MMARLAIVAALMFAPGNGRAAEITWGLKEQGPPLITIEGEIQSADDARFRAVAEAVQAYLGDDADIDRHVGVVLASPGGKILPGLAIGAMIRERGWMTLAAHDAWCTSTCAFIWLAGVPRQAAKVSYIGFHAAYNGKTGQVSGVANALLGSYLTLLGLRLDAIAFLTTAGPSEMSYLSAEAAQRYGIEVIGTLPNEANLDVPPVFATAVMALHLRAQPDPDAPNTLSGPGPEDFIPKNSVMRITGRCAVWTGSGRGAQDGDNIWCPVHYVDYVGWANAYFLMVDGQRVACINYPHARGCDAPPWAVTARTVPASSPSPAATIPAPSSSPSAVAAAGVKKCGFEQRYQVWRCN